MASAEVSPPIRNQPLFWAHLAGWFRAIPRAALLSMIGPSLLLVCGYFGWRFYGAKHYDAVFHGISKSNIIINQPPDWLKVPIVDQVYGVNGFERLSLFDSQTPAVIARAFDRHPAIRKTRRVLPMAGEKIAVSVEYRIPVAMVCLQPSSDKKGALPQWLPIDGESNILPTEGNFDTGDVNNYIWIYANDVRNEQPRRAGPFNDSRIEDAALLCQLLAPFKDQAKIKSVMVTAALIVDKTKWSLSIETHDDGPKIIWGSAPGWESIREPVAKEKLLKLLDIASDRTQWTKPLIDLTE